VRVVAATNEDLEQRIQDAGFRSDLFYRLNVFPIRIPPLRERQEDLSLLMRYFLNKFSRRHRRNVTGFTEAVLRALLGHPYPGNIRQLENMIERAVILSSNDAPPRCFAAFAGRTAASAASYRRD
jgi:transcriptional regulator with PAS, ATPase and Fis domain